MPVARIKGVWRSIVAIINDQQGVPWVVYQYKNKVVGLALCKLSEVAELHVDTTLTPRPEGDRL